MQFAEKETYSPMKNNVITQSARIYEIIDNAQKFKTYYNELVNNIIESLNNQCYSYVQNSRKSINIDIYEEVIKNIDWEGLRNRLTEDLKSKKPKTSNVGNWSTYGILKKYKIQKYDIDPIVCMHENCNEESIKAYVSYMNEAKENLSDLHHSVDTFERNLCAYRAKAINTILSKNINTLYNIHYNYVKDLSDGVETKTTVVLNNVELPLQRSQRSFITESLRSLICG